MIFGCTTDHNAVNSRYKGIFYGELAVVYSKSQNSKDQVAIDQWPPTWYNLRPKQGTRQPAIGSLVGSSRNHIERQLGPPVTEFQNTLYYTIR